MSTEAFTAAENGSAERDDKLLTAHADDLMSRADGGEVVFSDFLTPREQRVLRHHLAQEGRANAIRFFGGFPGAERCVACFLPDYLCDLLDGCEAESEAETLYLAPYVSERVTMLEIRGSGYRALTHRDVLGATLGLGIEHDAIGDIILLPGDGNGREQPRVYLMVTEKLAPFLLESLHKIGSDTVRVKRGTFPEDFVFQPKTRPISDTVASNRLDAVVGALANTAREKAQSLIRGGLVEVEYEVEQRTDARLASPCMISVRGYGKFRLLSLGEVTKKGRLRLRAEQYI